MIQIIQLDGKEKRLYRLVAPLAMDPDVLCANNNYPFKTTEHYSWFVACKGKIVVGFLPVEKRGKQAIINNYYIRGLKRNTIFSLLLEDVISTFSEEYEIIAISLIEDQRLFEENGFSVEREWTKYVKMKR